MKRREAGAPADCGLVLGHPTPKLGDIYVLGKKLWQGQIGTIYLCTEVATGVDYACKSISKRKLITREEIDDMRRKIQIMHHLSGHKNVVTIKGAYEDQAFVHVVMELCAGGDLFDRIIERGCCSEREAAELTRIIVGVVEACHSLGVMHRDLRPENFLFASKDDDLSLKAIGFGLSVFFKPGQAFTDVVGSPYYVAPEVLCKNHGPEADVWAAGIILYILLSGVPPFWEDTRQGLFDAILKGVINFDFDPWPVISDSAKDLITRMLNPHPAERLTAYEVLCHPWIRGHGVASVPPLDTAVLSRIKQFSAMNKLKKMALREIAENLSEEEIAELKEMFQTIDTDNSGAITYDELKEGLRRYGSTLYTEIHDLMDTRHDSEYNAAAATEPQKKPSHPCAPSEAVKTDGHAAPMLALPAIIKCGRASTPANLGSVLGHPTPNLHDLYSFGRRLRQGQIGTIYLCTELATRVDYACKSISKRKLITREEIDDMRREIQIMHHLSGHKNVVAIKGAYEDQTFVHVVMELCAGGELFDRIIQHSCYSERKAAELTRIIVGAVEACHSLGVMHRNLKVENFLFANKDDDLSLKAIDFGFSVFFKPGQVFTDVVGSPYYLAPEVLCKNYGPEADVWAAGIILYMLLSGVPPFWADTRQGIFDTILKGVINFDSDPWPVISDSAKDLITRMLNPRPAERLTAYEVLCHPWILGHGVAPVRPLDAAVLSRIKQFSAMNKLKKMALRVVAENLSEEDIAGLEEMFQAMETDTSGAITCDELKDGLRRYGSTLKDTDIRDLMIAVDVDNSGTIDYIEFVAATLHLNKLEHKEHQVAAFSCFDKDGSGYIAVDELPQACQENNMPDAFLDDVIKEADQDNTGMSSLLAVEAPMSSSLGAMGPLLRKLHSLLPDDYPLIRPLKDGIKLLKDDLEEISATLLEQSVAGICNQMEKFWMDEVRELSFDIDDFVDAMIPRDTIAYAKIRPVHRYRVGRVKTSSLPKNRKPSTRTAKVTELRTLVREASERHDRYLDGVTIASTTPCRVFTGHTRAPGLHGEPSSHLVGIENSKKTLIKWITDKAKQLKVVSVVGPAGVGKTTLAKQVYRELGVGGQFECWAFMRASRKPDMRRLLGGILSQVQRHRRPSGTSCCTVQDLIDNLTKHLQDKRYIIVIDDIWETTAWDIVKSAFPEGNNRSRIITTAVTEGMALECCGYQSNNILKMEPLCREESGKLFFNMVFGSGQPCPEQFKEVSDRIIEICAGLPLATICLAGLLASQPDNSELWRHAQECLSSNFSTSSTLEETLQKILMFSYSSLPHYLKTCLLYLSMYPAGYTMWKADLVKQWIAEGFIYATEGKDTWEIAESYFDELVSRGMILPVEINYNDEVLSCTLHHSVLDLIAHESNEEKFITALDYSQTITGFHGKARRLSLHFSNSRYATKPAGLTPSQARSLAFFGVLRCMPSIVGFKLLRVLVLEFCDIIGCESLDLAGICRLFQLRYLKISCDVTVELPAQMQRLHYLETLDIHAIVSAVPLDIIHLPGLLHLSLGDKANLPEGIGRVRSLRTLHYFDLGSSSEYNVLSLGELMNLQDLHFTYHTDSSDEHLKRNLVALACSLGKLINLKSVSLAPGAFGMTVCHGVWSRMSSPPAFVQRLELLPPICIFSRLPHWIGGLHKLRILTVVVTELLMKDVDMLTGLPDLKVLSLYVRQPTAESIVFRRGAFPALKYFKYTCGVLRLAFQEEALPKLQRLELGFNAHIGEEYDHLLTGIEHLPSLKEIGGIIGAAPGAEEQDRCTAESALEVAIQKHQRFSSYVIVKGADWVEEEHGPQEKQHLIEAEATAGGRGVVPTVVECALLWGLTSVSGRRRKMEDAVVAVPRLTSLPLCVTDSAGYHPMPFRLRVHFCGVYNGHGGAEVARYCRDRLHTALVEELSRIEPVSVANLGPAELQNQWEKVFVDCFCRVDDEVLGKASRGGGQGGSSTSDIATAAAMVQPVAPDHVGSTAVVAVICSSHIIVANCGDSRAVLCRCKLRTQPLSLDHTPSREDERARIEAGGGKTVSCNGYRVLGLLPVSRSIGDRYLKPWIIPVPEVTVVPRAKDDECLILASDSFWDVMSNEEARRAALKSILLWHKRNSQKSSSSLARRSGGDSADPAAQAAAAHLVELALQKGSKDDITVVVVDLKGQRKFKKRT